MKKMNYALLVLLAFVLASCSAYKQVPYLQASEYLDTSGQNTPSMMPASCPRTC